MRLTVEIATHATAARFTGSCHLPSWKGPAWKLSLRSMRNTIGMASAAVEILRQVSNHRNRNASLPSQPRYRESQSRSL